MEDGSTTADGAVFAQSLSALKERGSNLLVVGAAMEGAHREACDRLLGESEGAPRRRVFVGTDGYSGCGLEPMAAASDGDARLVVQETETRSAATATNDVPQVPTTHVADGDLGELAREVVDAVDDLAETAGDPVPAELRVCFDSLLPLFADHDDEQVFRALNLVTTRVRHLNGMGHYHLPADPDERTVRLLEPLFDAVTELRYRDGRPEQNWRLVASDVESGWLPI
ncbi:hypothetical protein BRC81_04070 [Halobacteriales archaeon QS_1_68_20]|nr:MAG: hypothetical protein BRC81_04070 [Halobacteriales archaeon QS_1_68_20]